MPMQRHKTLAPHEDIVKSLQALKDELARKYEAHHLSIPTVEMLCKINSCLFSKYPHH